MKLVYIAGPFRGPNAWAVEQNIRCAEQVGFEVAKAGAIPIIPHTMYRFWDGTLDDSFWLDCGIELLRKCDALVLCFDWQGSAGSRGEKAEAERLGLPVFECPADSEKIAAWITSHPDDLTVPAGPIAQLRDAISYSLSAIEAAAEYCDEPEDREVLLEAARRSCLALDATKGRIV